MVKLGSKKAGKYGLSLTKYMEYLLVKDLDDNDEYVETLDIETTREVMKSIIDIQEGRVGPAFKTSEDIRDYLDRIQNE